MSKQILLLLVIPFLWQCTPANENTGTEKVQDENPPAEGFNAAASDSAAITIADSVMQAMGGREAWNNTRYLSWNFFDVRQHYWDKYSGEIRIESLRNDFIALINLNDLSGRIQKNGEEVTNSDSLKFYIERAKNFWNNDAYWLIMPYKLKDSGVTLKYMGEDSLENAGDAHLLQLTFEDVGTTPDNKYHVWVDKNNWLVRKWAYFREASQDTANLVTPWNNYQEYGKILLSGDRGERQITNINVYDSLPEQVFKSFEPVNLNP